MVEYKNSTWLTWPLELFLELRCLLVVGEHSGSVVTAEAEVTFCVGSAFLLSAGIVMVGVDWEAGQAETTTEGDEEPEDVSIFVASCSRKDSMDPFVATDTFCKNALCFAATSGSLSLADARFGAAVDADSVWSNLKKEMRSEVKRGGQGKKAPASDVVQSPYPSSK